MKTKLAESRIPCDNCKQLRPLTEFEWLGMNEHRFGFASSCNECHKKWADAMQEANPNQPPGYFARLRIKFTCTIKFSSKNDKPGDSFPEFPFPTDMDY